MKLNITRYLNKTILIRLILYFVLIIAITLSALSYFIYNNFSSSFKDEITNLNHRVLNQVSLFADEFILRNTNELALNLVMNDRDEDIESFFSNYMEDKWKRVLNVYYKLDHLVFQNRDIVDSIFVYSKNNHILVSPKIIKNIDEKTAAKSDEFNWINTFGKSNKSILWLETCNTKLYSSTTSKESGGIITVVCSYPISTLAEDAKGYIAINIKEEALNEYLVKFNSTNLGQLMIIDNKGTIISHSDKSSLFRDISREQFVKQILLSDTPEDFRSNFDNTEYVVSFVQSKYNNWYYVSLVPTDLFYKRDHLIKQRLLVVSTIILFIVLVLSNIFSLSIYIPFKKIINKYRYGVNSNAHNKGINEFLLLDHMFSNMSDKINNLQDTLDKNMLMIRHNFITELLNNRITHPNNLENMLNSLNINFSKQYFCVAIFTVDKTTICSTSQTDIQFYRYRIIDFIRSLNSITCYYIPIDTNTTTISVIINCDQNQTKDIKQFITQVETFCFSNFNFYLTVGTGRFVKEIEYINKSNIDAKICMQNKFIHPGQNTFYYEYIIQNNININTIPLDLTEKFDKYLKLESLTDIQNIMNKFLSITAEYNIPYPHVRKEMSKFNTLLKQYLEDMNVNIEEVIDEPIRKKLLSPIDINEFIETFLQSVQLSLNYLSDKKLKINSELIESIKRYVMDNFYLDLSLNSVAETFYIRPNYLSKVFKDETGINYIDFVVECKMNKAKELLETSNLTVEEITGNIGYSQGTYFSRKFKEFTGKTPGQYRREMRISQITAADTASNNKTDSLCKHSSLI